MIFYYQKGMKFNDETWYSMRIKGETVGPRQFKKLLESRAWRLRKGSPNGEDLQMDEKGKIWLA